MAAFCTLLIALFNYSFFYELETNQKEKLIGN